MVKEFFDIVGKDSTWSMNFAARIQILSVYEWNAVDNKLVDPTQNFSITLSRFKFKGFAYNPKLTYKLELGLANSDMSGVSQLQVVCLDI